MGARSKSHLKQRSSEHEPSHYSWRKQLDILDELQRVKFMSLQHHGTSMNRGKTVAVCIVLLFSVVVCASNAVAEGDDIIIESNMMWSEEMTLTENVRVVNGGSLTISGSEVSIDAGINIYVDSESSISLENSKLVSVQPPSGLAGFGYCDIDNRSSVLASSTSNQNVRMYLRPIQGFTLDGVIAHFGNQTKNLSGDEDFIPLGNGPIDAWVGLTGPLCHPTSLSEISIERAGQERVWRDAADFTHRNMMVIGTPGFMIENDGSINSTSSFIFGGQLSSSGSLVINDSKLDRVGPILLTSDDSDIVLVGTTQFTNSTDDHDVRARAKSSISWGNQVVGSGGLTDRWERRVSGQSLSFDAMFVKYEISGMHKFPRYSNFSNENGVSYIDGGRERVVEIGWSEDNTWEESQIWSERAVVTITEFRTAWNPVESGIGDYGGGQFELVWDYVIEVDSGIPYVSWDNLSVVKENELLNYATVGDSTRVEAVISNSGSAAASLAINCEDASTDSEAQISPSFPNSIIGPGEQVTITFNWRVSVPGEESISCRILTPTQLVEELAFGGGQISSNLVNWSVVDDEEGGTIMPAVIALVISACAGGYFLFSIYNGRDEIIDD